MDTLKQKVTATAQHVKEKIQGPVSGSTFTTMTGCPIAHMKNSLTAGPHGPVLLQDTVLMEKLTQFTREKIPPRNVHPLGTGAYGTFTVTNDISKYTCAKVLQPGQKTNVFVRLSGTFLEQGEAETNRDLRGFAVKFYTTEGNWDLLCINTPVFNCRDGKVGPDAVHASKRDPRTGAWNLTQFWDFVVNHPESLHFVSMLYTDRVGTPMTLRHMDAYGCNTYSFINEQKERFWVKFHWISTLGAKGLDRIQAKLIAGEDPNFLSRDLHTAIEEGDFPKWKFCCQIMPEAEGYKNPFAFDCTKVWKHSEYPLIEIGVLELNRNPVNHFAEVEQSAFSPATIVPGIGFSPDKLLQARLLIYDDAQHHRIGPNHKLCPVNMPHGVALEKLNTPHAIGGNFQLDVKDKWPHYYPSNFGTSHPDPRFMEPTLKVDGDAGYYDYPLDGTPEDYYLQASDFWDTLNEKQRVDLCEDVAASIIKIEEELARQVISQFSKINPQLGGNIERIWTARKNGTHILTDAEMLISQLNRNLHRR